MKKSAKQITKMSRPQFYHFFAIHPKDGECSSSWIQTHSHTIKSEVDSSAQHQTLIRWTQHHDRVV